MTRACRPQALVSIQLQPALRQNLPECDVGMTGAGRCTLSPNANLPTVVTRPEGKRVRHLAAAAALAPMQ